MSIIDSSPTVATPPCPDWCLLDAGHRFDTLPYDVDPNGDYRWCREHWAYRTPGDKVYVWLRETTGADGSVELGIPLVSVDVDVCDLPQDEAERLFAQLGEALVMQRIIAGEAGQR